MNYLNPADEVTRSATTSSWIKSSLSHANGNCVEVTSLPGGKVGLRDSKDTEGPVLRFTVDEWRAFLSAALSGEFDALSDLTM